MIQSLPLQVVAHLGRMGGALAYLLDCRHRRVALANLRDCFGTEKSPREIRAIARENFRRIGEAYCCGVKTAAMSNNALFRRLEFVGLDNFTVNERENPKKGTIFAIGHFGNFELYVRLSEVVSGYRFAATYRALGQPALDQLLQGLRGHSNCHFFERRTEGRHLKEMMAQHRTMLGLLADQHAGSAGVQIPFIGRQCSTSVAPAVLTHRYNCTLYTAICFRTGLGKWRIEVGERIPSHKNGEPRSKEAIMRDVNEAFENAVLRDPANWFWVHRRWKDRRKSKPATRSAPVEAEQA